MALTVNQGDEIFFCTDDTEGVVVAIHCRDGKSVISAASLFIEAIEDTTDGSVWIDYNFVQLI